MASSVNYSTSIRAFLSETVQIRRLLTILETEFASITISFSDPVSILDILQWKDRWHLQLPGTNSLIK